MIKTLLRLLLLVSAAGGTSAYGATINIGVPSYSMSLVAFMAAKERGYYRQEGTGC